MKTHFALIIVLLVGLLAIGAGSKDAKKKTNPEIVQKLKAILELYQQQQARNENLSRVADRSHNDIERTSEKIVELELRIARYSGDYTRAIKAIEQRVAAQKERLQIYPQLIEAGRAQPRDETAARVKLLEYEIRLLEVRAEIDEK